jgi:uncharacterized membrane protein
MRSLYNIVAGHGIERLAALSDGIFAVVMTLLILDIRLPETGQIHSEADLLHALVGLGPRILVWLMSITTLGIFWVGQQTQLNHIRQSDRNFTWIHILFLAVAALVPFTTSVLGSFVQYRTALLLYWANIVLLGAMVAISWTYARHAKLIKDDAPAELSRAIYGRVVVAQILYGLGAALCIFSTYWSIAFIIAVQFNYAFAPVFGRARH